MKRTILFRGKAKTITPTYEPEGTWVYGFYNEIDDMSVIERKQDFCQVEKDSVGQFTGLTDKNGKRVFEGDIVIFNKGRNWTCVPHEIFYDERNVQFTIYSSPYATLQKDMMSECEVIGNIHDWENKKSID